MRRPVGLCAFCLAAVMAIAAAVCGSPGRDGPPDGVSVIAVGKVIQKDEDSFQIEIQTLQSENFIQTYATLLWQNNPKLISEYENSGQLILGCKVQLKGEFDAFSPASNPGEFDYARYYHSAGYIGRVKQAQIIACDGKRAGVREWLYKLRLFWEKRLYRVFPEKEASVMTAILLGDKTGIDADLKDLYRRGGVIHILSISGLHITVLGIGLYKGLRKLGMRIPAAAVCGGVLLVLYGLLTGFGVSACRAIGMYLLRMLSHIVGRTYDMLTALGVSAIVMLCICPPWLGNMGFLLSFGSILGVGVLLPALEEMTQAGQKVHLPKTGVRRGKVYIYIDSVWKRRVIVASQQLWETVRSGFMAGMSITLTTLPVQLWFSYEIPVYSVLINIMILPFMGLVMAAGLIAMLIPGLGFVGTADVVILGACERLCLLSEQLPFSMWNPGRPQVWKIVLYYFFLAMAVWGTRIWRATQRAASERRWLATFAHCAAPAGHRWKRENPLRLIALACAVLIMVIPQPKSNSITFLDVGQGDGICVRLASGEVYLFDCGSSSRKKIGEKVLIPFLKYHGITKVDAVFISHADADHVNGLQELFASADKEHIRIGQIVLPRTERSGREDDRQESGTREDDRQKAFSNILQSMEGMKHAPPVTEICAGVQWNSCAGKVSFLCLHPSADGTGDGKNESSECFYITFSDDAKADASGAGKNISILLTGDVEGSGERQLLEELKKRGISDIDIYKCAHHGSSGTNSAELLAQITPRCTVISCGNNNPYGHPHAELLERLKDVKSFIVQTRESGAVTAKIRAGRWEIATYK